MRIDIGFLPSPHLRSAGRLLCKSIAAVGAVSILAGATAMSAATTASAAEALTTIAGSFRPSTDADAGELTSPKMTIEVVLAPSNQADLEAQLANVYRSGSPSYHQWLNSGEFYSRYAPSATQIAAVVSHLAASGLTVEPTSSPFLVRASGPSSTVAAAFSTTLHNYRSRNGINYFANGSAVKLPASVAAGVLGVVGLTNTVRLQSHVRRAPHNNNSQPSIPACETPYPTETQVADALLGISGFPFGYGGGPGCNGLTPSQTNSLYDAPHLGANAKGQGVNLAVFELSAYQHSDIVTWAQTFYGPGYHPPLVDVTVDGGPLAPICPAGDTCPASFNGYAGDIEVDADIEIQLAVAPAARHLFVYNAPNDFTGQTELDEYTQIAKDNIADVISSSWSVCEQDVSAAYVQAENLVFEQMALQGQSMFGAEGDTGAFSCIRSDGTTGLAVLDPPAQPWVTSVGGTSFETFNPNANPNPSYPNGVESVWNFLNLCNASADEGGLSGFDWCAGGGAGGGGNSMYWGRPIYQFGPGIINRYTTYGNGTTQCSLAKIGTPCRETPDVSANADENTPYAEYCTGNANTPFSVCGTFSQFQTPMGWFGIGGTSLSSPLWSAIIGDRDGFWHARTGNANPLLYVLYNVLYRGYFHDITGIRQSVNNNGFFPTTPGFDMATGIGTPKIGAIVTGVPEL
jgi:subtilase family serine protease